MKSKVPSNKPRSPNGLTPIGFLMGRPFGPQVAPASIRSMGPRLPLALGSRRLFNAMLLWSMALDRQRAESPHIEGTPQGSVEPAWRFLPDRQDTGRVVTSKRMISRISGETLAGQTASVQQTSRPGAPPESRAVNMPVARATIIPVQPAAERSASDAPTAAVLPGRQQALAQPMVYQTSVPRQLVIPTLHLGSSGVPVRRSAERHVGGASTPLITRMLPAAAQPGRLIEVPGRQPTFENGAREHSQQSRETAQLTSGHERPRSESVPDIAGPVRFRASAARELALAVQEVSRIVAERSPATLLPAPRDAPPAQPEKLERGDIFGLAQREQRERAFRMGR